MYGEQEREQRKAWLASLKEGDEVCLPGYSRYNQVPSISKILRLTATQFVLRDGAIERRFRREDGRVIGKSYDRIDPVTDAARAEIELYAHRQWLNDIAWREDKIKAIPVPVLVAMHAAYDKAMVELEAPNG